MLSRGEVTPATVSYDTVASGLADYYYALRSEAPGKWIGRGSAAMGLGGEVADELVRLSSGVDASS
jgi:hypothetical protein